jgi:hypothetical protein
MSAWFDEFNLNILDVITTTLGNLDPACTDSLTHLKFYNQPPKFRVSLQLLELPGSAELV